MLEVNDVINSTNLTLAEKVENIREYIRGFIDDVSLSQLASHNLDLKSYGDVCTGIGFLSTLAREEAHRRDENRRKGEESDSEKH